MTERILIIDDEDVIAEILATFLEEKFSCDYVCTWEDGLKKLTSEPYNAVITDLEMPDVSGTQIIKEIIDLRIPVTVFISTGHDKSHPKVKTALALGAKDLLAKPFMDPEILIEVVRQGLGSS